MKLCVKINSGAAGLVWVVGYFILLAMVALFDKIGAQYPVALAGWTGGLVSILLKNNSNNKLDLAAAKAGNGTAEELNKIKISAGGVGVSPCA